MKRLYEILNEIEKMEKSTEEIIQELIPIVDEYYLYDDFSDVIYDEFIDTLVADMIKQGCGWERVKIFLSGIQYFSDYYKLDGYGNLRNITYDDLYFITADMIDKLLRR